MADLQLNGTTLFTESGGTVSFGSGTPQGMIINVTVHRDFTRNNDDAAGGGSTHTNWAKSTFRQLKSPLHTTFHYLSSARPAASFIYTLREALAIFFVSRPSSHDSIRYPHAVEHTLQSTHRHVEGDNPNPQSGH